VTTAQLTFEITGNHLCDFANFETGANAELVARLKLLAAGSGGQGTWLWGEAGSGRSHLLQAVCAQAAEVERPAFYLPLAQLPGQPMITEGLAGGVIALDDIDCWLGDKELEAALVGLYQLQLESDGVLVIASARPAASVEFAVPDLASRFRALSSYRVQPLDDAGLTRVLQASARRRGLVLNDATADFWLTRSRRSLPLLLAELDQLDQAALASQRRLTIPLLKAVLQL
jgi:DnaA-homolog protein